MPRVEPPSDVACRYALKYWTGLLSLSEGGSPFVEVTGAFDVDIQVPTQKKSSFVSVRLRSVGLQLEAYAAASSIAFHLNDLALISGYFLPSPDTTLRVVRAKPGSLSLSVDVPEGVIPASTVIPVSRACSGVNLYSSEGRAFEPSRADFWPEEAWGELLGVGVDELEEGLSVARWRGQGAVALSLRPGGKPVAHLRKECCSENEVGSDCAPTVLASREGFVHVAASVDGGKSAVTGWVPAAEVDLSKEGGWGLHDLGSGRAGDPFEGYFEDVAAIWRLQGELFDQARPSTCTWNSPLVADRDGVRRIVGQVSAGLPLVLGGREGELQEVTLEHRALRVTEGTRLYVAASSLYPCILRR